MKCFVTRSWFMATVSLNQTDDSEMTGHVNFIYLFMKQCTISGVTRAMAFWFTSLQLCVMI